MFSKIPAPLKIFVSLLLVAAFLFTGIGASSAQDGTGETIEVINPNLAVKHITTSSGELLTGYRIGGPIQYLVEENTSEPFPVDAGKILAKFPAYRWNFGGMPVAAAMIAGYYDRVGYAKMYGGPANNGVMPLTDANWPMWTDSKGDTYPSNPLVASQIGTDGRTQKGSIEDYWTVIGSTAKDPYITNNWGQHTWGTSIGDYMKTSQSKFENVDGSTWVYVKPNGVALTCRDMERYGVAEYDGTYGLKLFYEARGYQVSDCYSQKTDNKISGGYSLTQYKSEIDAGHPVIIHLSGLSVVGYGYGTGRTIYIRNTLSNSTQETISMLWGEKYQQMEMSAVSIVNVIPPNSPVLKAPKSVIYDTTPTFKFSQVWGATKYQLRVYCDPTWEFYDSYLLYTIDVLPGACGSGWCISTPDIELEYMDPSYPKYFWDARAYVSRVWKNWSAPGFFEIEYP